MSPNINLLQTVAYGLGELNDEMVFVGGAVAELYADKPVIFEARPTIDIDCVIEMSSKKDFSLLEEDLRTKEFKNDTSIGAPICRWIYKSIQVDIIPTDSKILGFSNRWYKVNREVKILKNLPNGTNIFVFPPEYYLAAKCEAHKGRGGLDLRQSHDFEDIIYMLNNCSDFIKIVESSNPSVKQYLKSEFQKFLANKSIIEGVESALPYGIGEEGIDLILQLMQNIATID